MNAVCASTVSLTSVSPTVIFRGPIFARQSCAAVARKASNAASARGSTPSRIGADTTTARLAPGASEKANSQAALRRPESERRLGAVFLGPLSMSLTTSPLSKSATATESGSSENAA